MRLYEAFEETQYLGEGVAAPANELRKLDQLIVIRELIRVKVADCEQDEGH